MRRKMREHPVDGRTFLDKEFALRIAVENGLSEQTIHHHQGDVAGDLGSAVDELDVLARLELTRFTWKFQIVQTAAARIFEIGFETNPGILSGRDVGSRPEGSSQI